MATGTVVVFRAAGGVQPYRWAVETNASGGHTTTVGFRCRSRSATRPGARQRHDVIITDFLGVVARAS